MKVPHDFQDYDDDDPEIDFRRMRDKFWAALRECRRDWFKNVNPDSLLNPDFVNFLQETYGMKIILHDDMITDKFEIVDEKLYTFFLLKYM